MYEGYIIRWQSELVNNVHFLFLNLITQTKENYRNRRRLKCCRTAHSFLFLPIFAGRCWQKKCLVSCCTRRSVMEKMWKWRTRLENLTASLLEGKESMCYDIWVALFKFHKTKYIKTYMKFKPTAASLALNLCDWNRLLCFHFFSVVYRKKAEQL